MQNLHLPSTAAPSVLPSRINLAIASSSAWPPDGDGWLHEIKQHGHRLVAILDGHGDLIHWAARADRRQPR
jgi:hypothetical protein